MDDSELVVNLHKKGLCIEEIARETNLPVGHFKEPGTIKKILYIESKRAGGLACTQKHPNKAKEMREKAPPGSFKKGFEKMKERNPNYQEKIHATIKKRHGASFYAKQAAKGGAAIKTKINTDPEERERRRSTGRKTLTKLWKDPEYKKKMNVLAKNNKDFLKTQCHLGGLATYKNNPKHHLYMNKKLKDPAFVNKLRIINKKRMTKEVALEMCKKSHESRKKNKNITHNGLNFDSLQEMKCCMLLEKQGYIPIEGKTLHVPIGTCEVDFVFNQTVIEWHPHDFFRGLSDEEYYDRRRILLDNNGFSNYELKVFKKFSEVS